MHHPWPQPSSPLTRQVRGTHNSQQITAAHPLMLPDSRNKGNVNSLLKLRRRGVSGVVTAVDQAGNLTIMGNSPHPLHHMPVSTL